MNRLSIFYMHLEDQKNLNIIAQAIFDKKGENILALDVRGISTMTDYYLIAEGSVDRHVKSLCRSVKDQLAALDLHLYHMDGEFDGEWIVMDFGSIVVHLLTSDMREKYSLEKLWHQAKIVDLAIKI